jgi:hypothetical protein
MYGYRGLGATALANAIFRQEGVMDANGNWIPTSLGYRLNNPGNLNYAGQPGCQPTTLGNGLEAQCDTLADGIAATENQLTLDASRGLTLAQRLATWATGNQAAYIANVSNWLGVDPNTPLSDLVGPDAGSVSPVSSGSSVDTGSLVASDGSVDTSSAGISPWALAGLGIAAVGIIWAVAG